MPAPIRIKSQLDAPSASGSILERLRKRVVAPVEHKSAQCAYCNGIWYLDNPNLTSAIEKDGKWYHSLDCALMDSGFITLQPNAAYDTMREIHAHVARMSPGSVLRKTWIDAETKKMCFEVLTPELKKDKSNERSMASCQQTESVPHLPARGLVPIRRPGDAVPPRPVKPPAQGSLW